MARGNESRSESPSRSEMHAPLLYTSLQRYSERQKRQRRPSIILAALFFLFLSSAGGIALAVVLMVQVVNLGTASLPRDLILFAGIMSLLYIGLHIRGARKDYRKEMPGPPQLHGRYLHASALLIARISIVIWIAALIATGIVIAKALPVGELAAKSPYLDLVLCIGAIPSFLIISITIERNPTPFATAAISSPSFLTCRVSDFADDIATDLSVSRRSSLRRKQSETGSVLTLPTEEIFRLGDPNYNEKTKTEPKQSSAMDGGQARNEDLLPMREAELIPLGLNPVPPSSIPLPQNGLDQETTPEVPQPVYVPGGWRTEWNNAQEARVPPITENPVYEPCGNDAWSSSYLDPKYMVAETSSSAPALSETPQQHPLSTVENTTAMNTQKQRQDSLPATASTSIASSAARSNLSTVRYAAEPEIAVQQFIKVVPNPAYQPPLNMGDQPGEERPVIQKPDPVVLLYNTQQGQKTETETETRVNDTLPQVYNGFYDQQMGGERDPTPDAFYSGQYPQPTAPADAFYPQQYSNQPTTDDLNGYEQYGNPVTTTDAFSVQPFPAHDAEHDVEPFADLAIADTFCLEQHSDLATTADAFCPQQYASPAPTPGAHNPEQPPSEQCADLDTTGDTPYAEDVLEYEVMPEDGMDCDAMPDDVLGEVMSEDVPKSDVTPEDAIDYDAMLDDLIDFNATLEGRLECDAMAEDVLEHDVMSDESATLGASCVETPPQNNQDAEGPMISGLTPLDCWTPGMAPTIRAECDQITEAMKPEIIENMMLDDRLVDMMTSWLNEDSGDSQEVGDVDQVQEAPF
ncbi:hypothetical protein F4802DRAFT_599336 [Xylaria palmicola]|nr:hypothetical protein F4802DRAFT_599336 [Xylaria palmicola]